jgi:hypothetical protein
MMLHVSNEVDKPAVLAGPDLPTKYDHSSTLKKSFSIFKPVYNIRTYNVLHYYVKRLSNHRFGKEKFNSFGDDAFMNYRKLNTSSKSTTP